MKKILFASTALVATAGIAAAEVSFSGAAGMGFGYKDGRTATTTTRTVDGATGVVTYTDTTAPADEWATISFATLSVAMTGETDGGLSFGADFDITAGSDTIDAAVVYIEGGFGKFSIGDVGSASDAMLGLSDIGFDGLGTDNVAETLIDAADQGNVMYEGTFGDFKVGLSHDLSASDTTSIAATYTMGDYNIGLGYDDLTASSQYHVQVGASIADFSLNALYSRNGDLDTTAYGITAGYTMNAVTVTAAYSNLDVTTAGVTTSTEGYGLGVSYDLGGGATLDAGVGELTTSVGGVSTSSTVADLGINMSF